MKKLKWWHIGLMACLLVAALSPFAASSPDGLERVATDKGFISLGQEAPFQVIADYVFPGIANKTFAIMLAAFVGTLILFGLVYGLAWLIRARKKAATSDITYRDGLL